MKRILLVIPSIAGIGGSEKLVSSLSDLLRDEYEVSVASFDPPGVKPAFLLKTPLHLLGTTQSIPRILRIVEYYFLVSRLKKLKEYSRPDVVISVLWRGDLINSLSCGAEKIVSLAVINIVGNPTNTLLVKFKWIAGLIYRRFNLVMAITDGIREEYCELFRLRASRTGVFRNFIAPTIIGRAFEASRGRFICCSRLVYEKNIDGLLVCFARFVRESERRQLIIIGDGPLRGELKAFADELGLSNSSELSMHSEVCFIGRSDHPELLMKGAIALLIPSRHEGVPTVAILAASVGLPILASDCHGGGMRALLGIPPGTLAVQSFVNGQSQAGILLPIPEATRHETIEPWVQAMKAVDQDLGFRETLVQGAQELGRKHSPEAVRDEWTSQIEALFH